MPFKEVYEPTEFDRCECGHLFREHVLVGDQVKCAAQLPAEVSPSVLACCPCPDFKLDTDQD